MLVIESIRLQWNIHENKTTAARAIENKTRSTVIQLVLSISYTLSVQSMQSIICLDKQYYL